MQDLCEHHLKELALRIAGKQFRNVDWYGYLYWNKVVWKKKIKMNRTKDCVRVTRSRPV